MARKISKARAKALVADLRTNLLNAEKNIIEIIKTRAWEALEYKTFRAFWDSELSDVRLATDALRGHVVFSLFDEGLSNPEIVEVLGGRVGDQSIAALRQQHEAGVAPADASTARGGWRKGHALKSERDQARGFRLEFRDADEFQDFRDFAKAYNLDLHQWALDELRAAKRQVERSRKRRAA
jgi:hypothetical protein